MTAPLKTSKNKWLTRQPRTAMEVYDLLPESTRSEVIDNTLYMPPTPSTEHQETIFDVGLLSIFSSKEIKVANAILHHFLFI